MRLHRFFVRQTIDPSGENHLSDASLVHQMRDVFRLRTGDSAIFFDGSGNDYVSEIVSLTRETCDVTVRETRPVKRKTSKNLALAFALVKKDNVEWIIQKGTELGVTEFILITSDRSEKKGFNRERAEKIMVEAVEQSGRGDMPTIRDPQTVDEFLADESSSGGRPVVAFHVDDASANVTLGESRAMTSTGLVVAIGPEGGWSEREVALFREKGAEVVSLDTPVLRAETAAVVACALALAR